MALIFAGCGGSENSSGYRESSSERATTPELKNLQSAAKQVEEERAKEAEPSRGRRSASQPDPQPRDTHHDRGGGSTQFRNKGGDDSVQDFGSEASPSEREAAAAVLHAYLEARAAHRPAEACFYMAARLVAAIERLAAKDEQEANVESCPRILTALSTGSQEALREAASADVGSLRLEGDRAFILYHGPQRTSYAMPIVREGGAWKVSSVEGTPLR